MRVATRTPSRLALRCSTEQPADGPQAPPPPPRQRSKRVALLLRGVEVARYNVPIFFPDFMPLDTASLPPLERAGGERTYRWQRNVLAGLERTPPPPAREASAQPPPRAPPPPPPEAAPSDPPLASAGSALLLTLTVLFYAVALALVTARGFVESGPAVMD